MTLPGKSKQFCRGCRDDVYNEPGNTYTGECWHYPDAQVVVRWMQPWWTPGDAPRAYTEVVTLSCHHAPGRYLLLKSLPAFAVQPRRLRR